MKNPVTRSTLFLTELILDLFIFILCTAVCVGLFMKARGMSRDSGNLTRAVYLAQTAAEEFRAGGAVRAFTEDGLTLTGTDTGEGGALRSALITVTEDDGREVFSLTVECAEGVTAP